MNDLVRAAIDLVRVDAEASGVPGPPYIDMKPAVVDVRAMWAGTDATAYAPIGSLFSSPHQARRARRRTT